MSERIQERRERIRKRMEAAKRMQKLLALKKTLGVFKEAEDETKDFVDIASFNGAKNVYDIDNAGLETVTNLEKSAQHSFLQHVTATRKRNKELKKQLEAEEAEMKFKFEEIMEKWKMDTTGPTELFDEIIEQRQRCSEVLNSKNNIIEILEEEHRTADEDYKDLITEISKVGIRNRGLFFQI